MSENTSNPTGQADTTETWEKFLQIAPEEEIDEVLHLITHGRFSKCLFFFLEIVGVPCLQFQEPNSEVDKVISQIRVHQHCVETEQRFRFRWWRQRQRLCV